MLVTLSWWQFLDVSDRISILVTSFVCWWPTPMLKDRGYWCQTRQKLSSTSQSCRQYISSPTSVTNIDVAVISPVKATAVICEEVSQAITGDQTTFQQITQIKWKHGQNNNTDTNCSLFFGHVLGQGSTDRLVHNFVPWVPGFFLSVLVEYWL